MLSENLPNLSASGGAWHLSESVILTVAGAVLDFHQLPFSF
jgi:hypothetical protein